MVVDTDGGTRRAVRRRHRGGRDRGRRPRTPGQVPDRVDPADRAAGAGRPGQRDVRRRLHEASVNRAQSGEQRQPCSLAQQIAALRAERAALMGFATHADLAVADDTAQDRRRRRGAAWPAGRSPRWPMPRPRRRCWPSTPPRTASSWPRGTGRSTPRRSRPERYAVDTAALRPYFELDRVLHDGVFFAAELVYGITFHPRDDLAGYHPDVRVWEVLDADGSVARPVPGRLLRPGGQARRGVDELVRRPVRAARPRPVVVNNRNYNRAPAGQPTLLTLDEVRTLFHEFGHALHGLFSDVTYPRFSGTERAARLRRVPQPGQRDVGAVAGGPGQLRRARRDRRAAAAGDGRRHRGRRAVGPGLRHHGVSRRDPARPGLAPPDRRTPPVDDAARLRGGTRWRRPGWPTRSSRRATGPPTSSTSSPAATPPATTPTSGPRCWTPTPWSGSSRTAG